MISIGKGLRCTIVFCLFHFGMQAQNKEVVRQSLFWVRYYNQFSFSKNWTWHNEFEDRRFFKANQQHHFILHSRLHYRFSPQTDFAFGLTYSIQSPQYPDAKVDLVVPELRPVQEINYVHSITERWTLMHRLRLDARFIHSNNGEQLLDGYDFNWRIRYRVLANCRLSKKESKLPANLKLSNELMLNAGSKIINNQFDQNRLYVGLEQGLNKNVALELGYLHWYQQRPSGYQFFDREIIRFTVYNKIEILP